MAASTHTRNLVISRTQYYEPDHANSQGPTEVPYLGRNPSARDAISVSPETARAFREAPAEADAIRKAAGKE